MVNSELTDQQSVEEKHSPNVQEVPTSKASLLHSKNQRLWVVGFTIIISLIALFGITSLTIELIIVRSKPEWKYAPPMPERPSQYENITRWGSTDSIPTSIMSDQQFNVFAGFILWVTVEISGLGLEGFVWTNFLQTWDQTRESLWRFAQLLFPLTVVTSIGMACHREFLSLPFLVAGMWKLGFPETIMYLYLGLFDRKNSSLQRAADFLNGVGTVSHHGAASFLICMLLAEVVPPSRYILDTCLILVMQHWFVLLSYVNRWLYSFLELGLEAWFEWAVISNFQYLYGLHWTAGLGTGVFLVAHWLYLIAAALDLISGSNGSEGGQNVHVRGTVAYRRPSAIGKGDYNQGDKPTLATSAADVQTSISVIQLETADTGDDISTSRWVSILPV